MSKEEIISEYCDFEMQNAMSVCDGWEEGLHKAMDEYAKDRVIEFIEWYFTEAPWMEAENFDEGLLFADKENDKITKEQLFVLFDAQKKSKT